MDATPETPEEKALIAYCKKAERNQLVAGLLLQNNGLCPDVIALPSDALINQLSEIPHKPTKTKSLDNKSEEKSGKAKTGKKKP